MGRAAGRLVNLRFVLNQVEQSCAEPRAWPNANGAAKPLGMMRQMARLRMFPGDEQAALRVTSFRRMWLGELVSQIGSQITILALPTLLVLSLHAGPLEVSLLNAAQYTALIVVMLKAGRLADRRDPRAVMGTADAVRALALLGLAVTAVVGSPPVALVFGTAVVIGAGQAFFDTSYSAVVPRLLDGPSLAGANSLFGQSQYLAFCLGPMLAGFLIRAVGGGRAVAFDGATFVLSGVVVAMLGRSVLPRAPKTPAAADSTSAEHEQENARKHPSAVRFVWQTAQLRAIALASATGNLGHQMVQGVYLVYVYRTLHLSSALVGLAFGIGCIAGIAGARLAAPAARYLGRGAALLLSTVAAGASWLIVLISGGPAFVKVTIAASLISLAMPLFGVIQAGLRQEVTPENLQGTASAGVSAIALSSVPVGFVLGGLAAEWQGTGFAILAGSLIAMTSGFWCIPLLSQLSRRVVDQVSV
jgi:Na+/melibiose symporter-like transporter